VSLHPLQALVAESLSGTGGATGGGGAERQAATNEIVDASNERWTMERMWFGERT